MVVTLWPNHRAQVGAYLLLIEETWRVKPPHGFVECEDGRHCIENTAELRAWVLEIEAAIRAEPCRKGYHNPLYDTASGTAPARSDCGEVGGKISGVRQSVKKQ
jgi:hypothetical protein